MTDRFDNDYYPDRTGKFYFRAEDANVRYPGRYWHAPWKPGEDFFTLTAKHGRPTGVFESGREHLYRAVTRDGEDS